MPIQLSRFSVSYASIKRFKIDLVFFRTIEAGIEFAKSDCSLAAMPFARIAEKESLQLRMHREKPNLRNPYGLGKK